MTNQITATHENGSILTHKATDKDVEYAIALMKECGYIRFRVETIGKEETRQMALDSKDPAAAGRRAAKASGE